MEHKFFNMRGFIVTISVGLLFYAYVFTLPHYPSENVEFAVPKLSPEFSAITPPKDAFPEGDIEKHAKTTVAVVSRRYSTSMNRGTVISIYERQLINNGWVFKQERTDLNPMYRSYCKGKYMADISIWDPKPKYAVMFEFSVSWSDTSEMLCAR